MAEDNLDEEEPFDDEIEADEVVEPAPKRVETRGRPPKAKVVPARIPVREEVKEEVVAKIVPFRQQAREGLLDVETKEVIASDIWEALAYIINQNKEIQDSIGKI